MTKIYKCAPLPFQGQKRFFVKAFADLLRKKAGEVDTVVDLFGGSGLLSHVAKTVLPSSRVVYNDFDGYTQRLAHIEQTNEILELIRERLKGVPHKSRLSDDQRADVLAVIEKYKAAGYVDAITIGRNLLFSGRSAKSVAELRKDQMYNNLASGRYDCAGYLDGLEVAHLDYRELFSLHKDNPRALFILDPPYLSTNVGQYEGVWRLSDYLDVLALLKDAKFIYFTSNKSQIVELCDRLSRVVGEAAPLYGADIQTHINGVNFNSKYVDMMLTNL